MHCSALLKHCNSQRAHPLNAFLGYAQWRNGQMGKMILLGLITRILSNARSLSHYFYSAGYTRAVWEVSSHVIRTTLVCSSFHFSQSFFAYILFFTHCTGCIGGSITHPLTRGHWTTRIQGEGFH